jgi:hypothetical protein
MQTSRQLSLSWGTLSVNGTLKMRIAGGDGALTERRRFADIDRLARLPGIVHIRINDAHHAIIEQQRHIGIVDAAHAHQRRDAAAERGARDVANGLEIEQRMLAIDENEIMPSRLRDAGDIAGARQLHRHAERDLPGLHARFDRVDQPLCLRRHSLAKRP